MSAAYAAAPTDTPDRLNYDKMAAIADLVESSVRGVAERRLEGRATEADTLALELKTLRGMTERHPLLQHEPIDDRESIERLVRVLVGQMGL